MIPMGGTFNALVLILSSTCIWSWWAGQPGSWSFSWPCLDPDPDGSDVQCCAHPRLSPPHPHHRPVFPQLDGHRETRCLWKIYQHCAELPVLNFGKEETIFVSVPISHVTSLQGTTAVLPCDVRSTSGWVVFFFVFLYCIFFVHIFTSLILLFLQADVFLVLWFKDNATKPMYR